MLWRRVYCVIASFSSWVDGLQHIADMWQILLEGQSAPSCTSYSCRSTYPCTLCQMVHVQAQALTSPIAVAPDRYLAGRSQELGPLVDRTVDSLGWAKRKVSDRV